MQNSNFYSEELIEIIEINRLEIAAFNLPHQPFKLSEKGTACKQRQQQSNLQSRTGRKTEDLQTTTDEQGDADQRA